MDHILIMALPTEDYAVQMTDEFRDWLRRLESKLKAKVQTRIDRLELGLFGDAKSVGDGVSELRVDFGPGYRIYYTIRGRHVVVLLVGGDKRSQKGDIEKAKELAAQID